MKTVETVLTCDLCLERVEGFCKPYNPATEKIRVDLYRIQAKQIDICVTCNEKILASLKNIFPLAEILR